jgi:hypothetical protein
MNPKIYPKILLLFHNYNIFYGYITITTNTSKRKKPPEMEE